MPVLCATFWSASAQSDRTAWQRSGSWEVGHYASIGCVIDNVNPAAPVTTMEWRNGRFTLMAMDKNWFGFQPGTSYDLIMRFTPNGVQRGRAYFQRVEDKQVGVFVWVGLDQSFLDALARSARLRVEHENSVLADYDLHGMGTALREREACGKAGGVKAFAAPTPAPSRPPIPAHVAPPAAAPLPSETNPIR